MIPSSKRLSPVRRWPFGAHTTPPMPPMVDPGLPGIGDPAHIPVGEPPANPDEGGPLPTPTPPHTPIAPPGIPQPSVTRRRDH